MKTYLECLPCVMRQALEGARQASDDEDLVLEVLRRAGLAISQANLGEPSPVLIGVAHRIIREVTGNDDPYQTARATCNRNALTWYPRLKEMVSRSPDPFETAVRLALAGNTIDFVVNPKADEVNLDEAVHHAMSAPLPGRVLQEFRDAVRSAGSILYLGDNAGEIVFDRLLVEQLPAQVVTFAVKGRPVINDITYSDADQAGLSRLVEVIDNGSDLPGTILAECSGTFRTRFQEADLVISKGQGNYESLDTSSQQIFFLFKAKCPVIVMHLHCSLGDLVLAPSDRSAGSKDTSVGSSAGRS